MRSNVRFEMRRRRLIWIFLVVVFAFVGSQAVYNYQKAHLLSKAVSQDGKTTVMIQAQRQSWNPEGFEVRALCFEGDRTSTNRTLVIDTVDLLSDAHEAYGNPRLVEGRIIFDATEGAVTTPITLDVDQITEQGATPNP